MRVDDFCRDYGIPTAPEGHKHARPGWLGVACPFCTGNFGYHLGYNTEDGFWHCWRCGWHPEDEVIAALAGSNRQSARALIREYGGRPKVEKPKPARSQAFRFPSDTGPMHAGHRRYLQRRGFDSDHLAHIWGVCGAGPVANLDHADYSHRIIAPIHWGGQPVSFQGRAISDRQTPKYRACPKTREAIPHKTILYGQEEAWSGFGVCVEGITDVWRLGPESFATFGVDYSIAQLRIMAARFRRIAILYDADRAGQRAARMLRGELRMAGVDAFIANVQDDPAELTDNEAHNLMDELRKDTAWLRK